MTVARKPVFLDVIRARPPRLSVCHAAQCGRRIEWVTTLQGKRMPVDHPLLVERTTERLDGSLVSTIDAARTHWATCPAAKQFKRTGGR